MKSRMPSVWRSIRELWFASGGPWCSWPYRDRCGLHQASAPGGFGLGAPPRTLSRPTSTCSTGLSVSSFTFSIRPSSSHLELLAGEGRDQDVVDPVVLDRVLDRRERLGAHRLTGRVDLVAVHLGERARQALADLLARDLARARADERVAVRSLLGAVLQPPDQLRRVDGLGRDDERVGDVPADRVVVDADRDMRRPEPRSGPSPTRPGRGAGGRRGSRTGRRSGSPGA